MALTEIAAKNAKPQSGQYKLSAGDGMYLLIKPTGGKYWRLKYRYAGKEKIYAIGVYPEISLKLARELKDDIRVKLRNGIDPTAERKAIKQQKSLNAENTFKTIALEWLEKQEGKWTEKHIKATRHRMESNLFHALGNRPIKEITPPELLAVLKKMEGRGAIDLAHRGQQTAGQIFRYAIATGRAERDISADLRGALKTQKKESHAYLKEGELPEFLQKLENYDGDPQTQIATKLLLLTFVRTGELRAAKWEEVNFDKAEWRIPAARMKMRETHIVPLSKQALALFEKMRKMTGNYECIFPNRNKPSKSMSENTILFALYRMGYHSRTTAHGFRATASTILHEHGFASDYIEAQLAHAKRNKVRASYDHAKYLKQRHELMQWWADFLDKTFS